MKTRRAFTLLETLLALTIIIMILGTVYAYYGYAVRLTVRGREKLEETQMARVALMQIAAELKGLTTAGSHFTAVITGESDRIGFITTVVPSRLVFFPQDIMDKGRVIEHDLRYVEYAVAKDPDTEIRFGLQRDELRCLLTPIVEKKAIKDITPEDLEKQRAEAEKFRVDIGMDSNAAMSDQPLFQQALIADRIKFLRFDYYDGTRWTNTWHGTGADVIPRAIQVTVGFQEMSEAEFKQEQLLPLDQRPWHDDRYSLVVSLVLSDDLLAQYAGSTVRPGEGESGEQEWSGDRLSGEDME